MTHIAVSPEEKPYWCARGEQDERDFVEFVASRHGLSAIINPAKRLDPYAPDLIVDGALADLKAQRTPFFTAGCWDGFDPQFAVTLNAVDVERYSRLNSDLVLLFWVRWDRREYRLGSRTYRLQPMEGVWRTTVSDVTAWIESGAAPLHVYRRRLDDMRRNARASYVLDLGWMDHLPHVFEAAA
jgi:hypothetical protein